MSARLSLCQGPVDRFPLPTEFVWLDIFVGPASRCRHFDHHVMDRHDDGRTTACAVDLIRVSVPPRRR